MKIRIDRRKFTSTSTIGDLYVDGEWLCYTLEDRDRYLEIGGEKVYGETAIPRGTYEVAITESPRFGRRLPILLDVPEFSGIRIHPGNDADDTEGCILVGLVEQHDFVGNSRVAFSALLNLLESAAAQGERITLEVA